MKAKKLAAFLAAALAVTSLNVAAFATGDPAGNETDDVSKSCQFMLKLQSENPDNSTSKAYDGSYAGASGVTTLTLDDTKVSKDTATSNVNLTFSYNVGPITDSEDIEAGTKYSVTVEGLKIKATKTGVTDQWLVGDGTHGVDKTWTTTKKNGYWDGDQPLTLSTSFTDIDDFKKNGSIVATWTSMTVTTPKAADTSDSSDSSSSGDPEDPEDGPVVEMSTEKVFGAWESYEFTHDVVEGDVIAITYKDKLANGPNDYSCILLQCNVSDTLYTANVQGDLADAAGTFKYTITAADVTTINGTKIRVNGNMITITNITINPEDDPEDTSATDATTAAPGNDPGYVVITPDDTTAATTEAPEVVTGANGESVEAAKDVVPAGATLEAKEQTKEEAVKAVEAVKATDANKEVVETVKKAIEDAKAAVMDINLVKDGVKVQPNGTIKVTVKVPEALKSAANLFVYRVEADGTFTDVKATVKDGKIEFTTSHFSTYIITSEALTGDAVVTEAAATTEPAATTADGNTTTDDKNQATGVVLAVIPAMLAAAGVIAAKKRK